MGVGVGLCYRPGVASATRTGGGEGRRGETTTVETEECYWLWRRREDEGKEGGLDGIRIHEAEQRRIQSSNEARGRRGTDKKEVKADMKG